MIKIEVYIDNGNVHFYEVKDEATARDHMNAIIQTGYRSVTEGEKTIVTWFPPHRIVKVKATLDNTSSTLYFDNIRST